LAGHSRLADLCAPLRLIVEAELAAGNRILRIEDGTKSHPTLVILADPFQPQIKSTDSEVTHREINIRGIWKAHFIHVPSGHVVACGFGD
jgi:hypothetical protein